MRLAPSQDWVILASRHSLLRVPSSPSWPNAWFASTARSVRNRTSHRRRKSYLVASLKSRRPRRRSVKSGGIMTGLMEKFLTTPLPRKSIVVMPRRSEQLQDGLSASATAPFHFVRGSIDMGAFADSAHFEKKEGDASKLIVL